MSILTTLRDILPTIRRQKVNYDENERSYGYKQTRPSKLQVRYWGLQNKDIRRCLNVYKNTALACEFTIDTDTKENDNIPTTEYLKRVFNEPEGTHSTKTYIDINNKIYDSYLGLGDCFFEISTDEQYGILNGFKYIHNKNIQYNTENDCFQLMDKPEVMYEPHNLVHIQSENIDPTYAPWGTSLIDDCAGYIALLENALQYNNDILYNDGLDPHTILSYPESMSVSAFNQETKRLNMLKKKQRLSNGKKGMVAVHGATVQKATNNNKDMNYLQMMQFAQDNIIEAFGIPPQIFGKIETANLGSGSGDSQKKDWKSTFEGACKPVETEFNRVLKYHGFTERFHYGKLDVIDELYDAQVAQILIQSGVKTRDEVRNEMGLDKLKHTSWGGYYS